MAKTQEELADMGAVLSDLIEPIVAMAGNIPPEYDRLDVQVSDEWGEIRLRCAILRRPHWHVTVTYCT